MNASGRTSLACLALLLISGLACAQSEPGVTESDAISMGFELLDCSPIPGVKLYADLYPSEVESVICDAVRVALERSMKRHLTPAAATRDSVAVIVAYSGRYARLSADSPESFRDVTFDLVSRTSNLRIVLDDPGVVSEISWAPKGLRY